MHIVVSWDISASGNKPIELEGKMIQCLKRYPWVRPLKSTYVVQVTSEEDRKTIINSLTEVANEADVSVNFILTPLMSGGRYNGYLPHDMWEKINKISDI